MALPYVTPGQLALVENKINDLNEKLTDEDIDSIKAVQSPKDATAGQVLTADGAGKAVYKDVSTKTLWTGWECIQLQKDGKTIFSFAGVTTFNWTRRFDSSGLPQVDFLSELDGLNASGYGTLDYTYSDTAKTHISGKVCVAQVSNIGTYINIAYIDDTTGYYHLATLDVDSTMTVYKQLSYCKKIQ